MAGTYGTGVYGSVDGTYALLTIAPVYAIELLEGVTRIGTTEGAATVVGVLESVGR